MQRLLVLMAGILGVSYPLFSQSTILIIKANSKIVTIRDGDILKKDDWTVTPSVSPDVYTTAPSKGGKRVIFYTDLDSISFDIKENAYYSFRIILNNKDTALTGVYAFDTLITLKHAGQYNYAEKRVLPAFTYQSAKDSNLKALRKEFHLDSIAGRGNQLSQILNMLHWIHDLIPHDGNHENPVVKNAMNMITVCKKDNRGLNCRGLSMVLNECYLAIGFKSRFVTCLPKDSLGIDNDCHVIVSVYSYDLKKWIWIDPTFDAYVMNEKGELLSIEEVRERIIGNKPLVLNPGANWNHKVVETREYYLYSYMAKNLYRLECHANSEYDLETRSKGKTEVFVDLLPNAYFNQLPIKLEYYNKELKTNFVTYKTNNPAVFWAAP